jgi:HSP20 family molecular chaperone IbpA
LDLPDFKQGEVNINIDKDILNISAKNDKRQVDQSFSLWSGLNLDNPDAKLEDRVLKITLCKDGKAKKKKIEIY